MNTSVPRFTAVHVNSVYNHMNIHVPGFTAAHVVFTITRTHVYLGLTAVHVKCVHNHLNTRVPRDSPRK